MVVRVIIIIIFAEKVIMVGLVVEVLDIMLARVMKILMTLKLGQEKERKIKDSMVVMERNNIMAEAAEVLVKQVAGLRQNMEALKEAMEKYLLLLTEFHFIGVAEVVGADIQLAVVLEELVVVEVAP